MRLFGFSLGLCQITFLESSESNSKLVNSSSPLVLNQENITFSEPRKIILEEMTLTMEPEEQETKGEEEYESTKVVSKKCNVFSPFKHDKGQTFTISATLFLQQLQGSVIMYLQAASPDGKVFTSKPITYNQPITLGDTGQLFMLTLSFNNPVIGGWTFAVATDLTTKGETDVALFAEPLTDMTSSRNPGATIDYLGSNVIILVPDDFFDNSSYVYIYNNVAVQ